MSTRDSTRLKFVALLCVSWQTRVFPLSRWTRELTRYLRHDARHWGGSISPPWKCFRTKNNNCCQIILPVSFNVMAITAPDLIFCPWPGSVECAQYTLLMIPVAFDKGGNFSAFIIGGPLSWTLTAILDQYFCDIFQKFLRAFEIRIFSWNVYSAWVMLIFDEFSSRGRLSPALRYLYLRAEI